MNEDEERTYRLREKYGKPEMLPLGNSEVISFRYRDKEAYDAYVAANAEHHPEVTQLGFTEQPDGTIIGSIRVAVRRT